MKARKMIMTNFVQFSLQMVAALVFSLEMEMDIKEDKIHQTAKQEEVPLMKQKNS